MTPKPYTPPDGAPDDVVTGSDPAITITTETIEAYRHSCDGCGFVTVELVPFAESQMADHVLHAHPAARNPVITCHARAPWDHERWCVRPVDHDGRGHWTPSFTGGRWWRVW